MIEPKVQSLKAEMGVMDDIVWMYLCRSIFHRGAENVQRYSKIIIILVSKVFPRRGEMNLAFTCHVGNKIILWDVIRFGMRENVGDSNTITNNIIDTRDILLLCWPPPTPRHNYDLDSCHHLTLTHQTFPEHQLFNEHQRYVMCQFY